jgi:peptidoglycan/LPS O-acetylase OafA/YrhL
MPALTGIRGWAALWVLLFHVTLFDEIRGLKSGYLGVDAFFILSGFVLSHGYAMSFNNNISQEALTRFFRGRFTRIYPLHILMLAVTLAIILTLPDFKAARSAERFSSGSFVASAMLVQNWGVAMPICWNSPTWSLSAEWFAYLTFPFLVLLILRLRSRLITALLAFGLLGILVFIFELDGRLSPDAVGTFGMVRMMCEFTAGTLLWRVAYLDCRLPSFAGLVAAALLAIGAIIDNAAFIALPAFGIFILLAATGCGLTYRVLAHPISILLGNISYSVYLIHYIPLDVLHWAVEPIAPKWIWILCQSLFVPVTLVISYGIYRWFEMPAKRLLNLGLQSGGRPSVPLKAIFRR